MGFVNEIKSEMQSIVGNDNRGVQQTMPLYFKGFDFLEINITKMEVSVTCFAFGLTSQFRKNVMFSIEMDTCTISFK